MARSQIARTSQNRDPIAGLVVTWQNANTVDGDAFRVTGRELLLVRNNGATTANLIIDSVPDPYRRERDINENIQSGETRLYGPFSLEAWRQNDGMVYINANSTDIQYVLISL